MPSKLTICSSGSARGVAQRCPHAGQQFARAERLGDIVVGAQLEQQNLVGDVAGSAEHDDGQSRRQRLDLFTHVAAGNLGQTQIQNDGGRRGRLETVERRSAIGLGFDGVPLGFKKPAQGFLYGRIVFDDEDAAGGFGDGAGFMLLAVDKWRGKVPHNDFSCDSGGELPVNPPRMAPSGSSSTLEAYIGLTAQLCASPCAFLTFFLQFQIGVKGGCGTTLLASGAESTPRISLTGKLPSRIDPLPCSRNLDSLVVVLVRPRNPLNIGAAARAMTILARTVCGW